MKSDELKNNYKTSSTLEGALPMDISEVNIEPVQEDYDTETSSILEGNLEINGVTFPPPTTAFIMFLDLIRSPFLYNNTDTSLNDIYDALFVLKYREQAVSDVYGMFSAKKYLDKYEPLIEKSPEYLDVVLKYRERYEQKLQKFHSLAAAFGEKIGIFDIQEVAEMIKDYISACFGGFEMIPQKTDGKSKKKDLTVNG